MPGKVLVGTASWTDPGFVAHWYPPDLAASDRLRYYADHFNFVEVNSTFYSVPVARVVQRWCEQTPPGFTFDVKLHRLLSRHSTQLKFLPPELRRLAKVQGDRVLVSPQLEQATVRFLLTEIQPLADAGKFGAFLLQLTPAFSPRRHKLSELEPMLESLAGWRVAVELRNRHWALAPQLDDTLAFFKARRVTFVTVDAPEGEHFMTMPGVDVVTNPELAYMRLHGRNLTGYVTGRTVAERFDYLYTNDELEGIAERVASLANQARQTHVVYNNNAADYALQNAKTFRDILTERHAGLVEGPPGLAAPAGARAR